MTFFISVLFMSSSVYLRNVRKPILVLLNLNTLRESSNPLQSKALQKWVCEPTSTPTIKVSDVTCINLSFCVTFIARNLQFDLSVFVSSAKMNTLIILRGFFLFYWRFSELQEFSNLLPNRKLAIS